MSSEPQGIPSEAPNEPRRHPDRDFDIIIKLVDVCVDFVKKYADNWLNDLIPEGLDNSDDIIRKFQNKMEPTLDKNKEKIIDFLTKQRVAVDNNIKTKLRDLGPKVIAFLTKQRLTVDNNIKTRLNDVGLTGDSLQFKDRSIRAVINKFLMRARDEISKTRDTLRILATPVFNLINSFFGSLKAALKDTLPGVGAAIEVIKQIKDHLQALSSGPPGDYAPGSKGPGKDSPQEAGQGSAT